MSSARFPPLHDFEPASEYEVVDLKDLVDEDTQVLIRDVLQKAKDELCPVMGFANGFQVFCVSPGSLSDHHEDAFAVYCNGTSSRPVIGLDIFMLQLEATRLSLDLQTQLQITVAHELGHAYHETIGRKYSATCERLVESFGAWWARTGLIDLSILKMKY